MKGIFLGLSTMKKIFTSPFFTPAVFCVCWGAILFVVLYFFPEQKYQLTKDGEIFEILTNIGYMTMLAAMLYFSKDYTDKISSWGIYLFLGMSAFLREAGIQHHLSRTDTTPFKSRFFLKPENPIGEKIVFGLLLLIIFGTIVYLMVKYAKHLVLSFFKFNTVTWTIATFFGILVFSKFADRFPGNWRDAHNDVSLPQNQIEIWSLLEESIEIFIPWVVVIAFTQFHIIKKQKD